MRFTVFPRPDYRILWHPESTDSHNLWQEQIVMQFQCFLLLVEWDFINIYSIFSFICVSHWLSPERSHIGVAFKDVAARSFSLSPSFPLPPPPSMCVFKIHDEIVKGGNECFNVYVFPREQRSIANTHSSTKAAFVLNKIMQIRFTSIHIPFHWTLFSKEMKYGLSWFSY